MWALVRQNTAHSSAFWTVILACGHAETMVTDIDWVFGARRSPRSRTVSPPGRSSTGPI
jgi:hypothetical protein